MRSSVPFTAGCVLAAMLGCKSPTYRPDAVKLGTDEATGEQMVHLEPVLLRDTWDGEVTFELHALLGADRNVARLVFKRSSEYGHYDECDILGVKLAKDDVRAREGTDVTLRSEMTRINFVETAAATVDRSALSALLRAEEPELLACSDTFPLREIELKYVKDFLDAWESGVPASE